VVTLEQLLTLEREGRLYHTMFHWEGRTTRRVVKCERIVGSRGGVTEHIAQARVSGSLKTWKRDPERFRLPVKHGLYVNGEITKSNAHQWHVSGDCPLAQDGAS
jgi:hypothetical protein